MYPSNNHQCSHNTLHGILDISWSVLFWLHFLHYLCSTIFVSWLQTIRSEFHWWFIKSVVRKLEFLWKLYENTHTNSEVVQPTLDFLIGSTQLKRDRQLFSPVPVSYSVLQSLIAARVNAVLLYYIHTCITTMAHEVYYGWIIWMLSK